MSLEILARRNAKGVDPESVGHSTKITIDTAHINAGCYGIPDLAQALLDARVGGDIKQYHRILRYGYGVGDKGAVTVSDGLFEVLFSEVIQLSIDRKWQSQKKGADRLRKITVWAVDEVVNTPMCKTCHGTKFDEFMKTCSKCGGTGRKRKLSTYAAKQLDMDRTNWRKVWLQRYADIICMIEDIMLKAGHKITYRIYKD